MRSLCELCRKKRDGVTRLDGYTLSLSAGNCAKNPLLCPECWKLIQGIAKVEKATGVN